MKEVKQTSFPIEDAAKMPTALRERLARALDSNRVRSNRDTASESDALIGAEAELFDRVRQYRPGAVPFVDLSSTGSRGWGSLGVALLFVVIVAAMTWFEMHTLTRQYAVRDWKPVPAQIDVSRVEVTTSSGRRKRTNHDFKVVYSYEVNGARYTGNAVDRSSDKNRSKGYAQARMDEFPAGKTVTAYVDPANPSQAVLKQDLLLHHGVLLIFVIPIIPWIIKLAVEGYQSAIAGLWKQPAAGLATTDDGTNLYITLPRYGVVNFTMNVWFGLLLAVTIYFIVFGVIWYTDISFGLMLGLYALTIPMAIVAGAIKISTLRSGTNDLSVNRITREVMLPATFRRSVGVTVPIDSIQAVQTSDVMSRTKHGKEYRSATKVELLTEEGEHTLAIWKDARRADNLGAYLAQVLGEVKLGTGGATGTPAGRRVVQPRKLM